MNTYALTTVARLKSFLEIDVSTYDSILGVIIDAVTDFIESECDRRFKKTAHSGIILDGEGSNELTLPNWPVVEGETFTLYERTSVNYGDNTWKTISSDKYRIDYNSGIVIINSKFYKGHQNYKVDFTAGYAFDNVTEDSLVPLSDVGLSDLELLVWKICAKAYNDRKGGGNIKRMKLYNYDVTYSDASEVDDKFDQIIEKYKRFTF